MIKLMRLSVDLSFYIYLLNGMLNCSAYISFI
jgi:hypothetical protein